MPNNAGTAVATLAQQFNDFCAIPKRRVV